MRAVGIRELKNRLSEFVRMVRSGERVLITDRGVVVAELRQPSADSLPGDPRPELARAIRAGDVSPAASNDAERYPPLEPLLRPGRSLELLDRERGEH